MDNSKGFRGQLSFLSNFTKLETPMKYGNLYFSTVEHFYQAVKFEKDSDMRDEISKHPSKGLKKLVNSKKDLWRADWDEVKLDVMEYGLRYKFNRNYNPILYSKLQKTKGVELIEYNWWKDKFWGVCLKTGEGENNLGKLLMKIREGL